MPRRPRIHLDNVPLHIVQRGHNRQPYFFVDADKLAYLEWLADATQRTNFQIHAYALMTNHVHLLLTPGDAQAISNLMVSLGRRYVPYINATYQRRGTSCQRRYKSSLIQSETYMLACMRYIELNPVRAAMCHDPAGYRWSSYRANALGEAYALLTPHPLYTALVNRGQAQIAKLPNMREAFADFSKQHDKMIALVSNTPPTALCNSDSTNMPSAQGMDDMASLGKFDISERLGR